MLFLLPPASADVSEAPTEAAAAATVMGVVPLHNATDVPRDAVPAAVLEPGTSGEVGWTLAVLLEDAVLASVTAPNREQLLSLSDSVPLPADTMHSLEVSPTDGVGFESITTFRTGANFARGLGAAPDSATLSARWRPSGTMDLSVTVVPGEDPHQMAIIRVVEGWASPAAYAVVGLAPEVSFSDIVYAEDRPDEWCVVVEQRDAVGTWTPLDVCAAVEDAPEDTGDSGGVDVEGAACGCSSGVPMGGIGALAAAFFLRRRRGGATL